MMTTDTWSKRLCGESIKDLAALVHGVYWRACKEERGWATYERCGKHRWPVDGRERGRGRERSASAMMGNREEDG